MIIFSRSAKNNVGHVQVLYDIALVLSPEFQPTCCQNKQQCFHFHYKTQPLSIHCFLKGCTCVIRLLILSLSLYQWHKVVLKGQFGFCEVGLFGVPINVLRTMLVCASPVWRSRLESSTQVKQCTVVDGVSSKTFFSHLKKSTLV